MATRGQYTATFMINNLTSIYNIYRQVLKKNLQNTSNL